MVRVPTDISEGGISDYKSDYVVREIEIPPVKTRGKSTSWRLGGSISLYLSNLYLPFSVKFKQKFKQNLDIFLGVSHLT